MATRRTPSPRPRAGPPGARVRSGLTEKYGAVAVLLTRLSPFFPFNLLNYSFGLTRVRFWTYVFWSWLGMLPGTVFVVLTAAAAVTALARGEIPWLLVGTSLAAGTIVAALILYARKKRRTGR